MYVGPTSIQYRGDFWCGNGENKMWPRAPPKSCPPPCMAWICWMKSYHSPHKNKHPCTCLMYCAHVHVHMYAGKNTQLHHNILIVIYFFPTGCCLLRRWSHWCTWSVSTTRSLTPTWSSVSTGMSLCSTDSATSSQQQRERKWMKVWLWITNNYKFCVCIKLSIVDWDIFAGTIVCL